MACLWEHSAQMIGNIEPVRQLGPLFGALRLRTGDCCVENIIMNKEPLPMEGVGQDSDRGFFEEIAIGAGGES